MAPRIVLAAFTALLLGDLAPAAILDWTGATSGNLSGTPANWNPAIVPTGEDSARWNAASYTNAPTANANMTIGQLLFEAGNSNGVNFFTGASTLTLNGVAGVGIQMDSGSGAVSTGAARFALGGDQTWLNNAASTLTVAGTITNASNSIARTLTVDGTGETVLSGVISNNGAGTTTLSKIGSGLLTLNSSGGSSFTGGLNVQEGTVKLLSNSGAGGAGLITIGSNGKAAVLDLGGSSRTINSLATAGTAGDQRITNSGSGGATLNYTGATTSSFGGVIEDGSVTGTIAVIVNNASANLTLSGANTYSGLTTVTAGTLKIGATNAIKSGNALSTSANGTFDLNGHDQTIGTLVNNGTVTNSVATKKTFTFGSASSSSGSGSFTGAMDVIYNPLSNVAVLSASWLNVGDVTVNANASNTITLGGTINNTGTFTNSGSGGNAPLVVTAAVGANVGLITQNSATSALTLSGANTNTGGVNLTRGTLKLGSTTALGATASSLTIAADTTIDSIVADLTLVNNNAQNWNGDFTFTGTQSLNLGAGAVTLARPLTITTGAKTLTFGGAISGGTIFDITKAGAGALAYNGNAVLTENVTLKVAAGTLSLGGATSGAFGLTLNGPATLAFTGANGGAAAATVTANTGASLAFDSSTSGVAGATRAAGVNLQGASLTITGNATANSVDTIVGALNVGAPTNFGSAGASTVAVMAGAVNAQLVAGNLVRSNNGAVFFRGTNLGQNTILSQTAGSSSISFSNSPAAQLVGGGGAAGTQNISILPWAVGSTSATGAPTSFVTYDANGVRPLKSDEYSTSIPASASSDNVRLSAATPVTFNGATTINSLFVNNADVETTVLAGTGALTVTSGAIYGDLSFGGNNDHVIISKPIDFGTTEGVIGALGTAGTAKRLVFSGGISGSGGLTIYDASLASNVQGGVSISAATTYTGNTIINGALVSQNANALPNFANNGRTGDVFVNGSFGVGGSTRINGLFGTGRVINPFSTGTNLTLGDNNATSTFEGIFQASTLSLIKVGTGTLTLTNTGSGYTNSTVVQNGTISVVTLNSVAAPAASSTLGRPSSVTAGTIGLGSSTTTGTLKVVGTGEVTDRVINLAGTTGGGTLDQSGTGLLKFTSDFTATGAGSKTLTLQGSTSGTGEIAGAIVDNNATRLTSVAKAGTGTWTLSGTSNYTGGTTVSAGTLEVSGSLAGTSSVSVAGGTLRLSGAGGIDNKLKNTASVALAGGRIDLSGITATSLDQSVGALTLSVSSSIDFGSLSAGNTFRFADSSAASWGQGATLSIYDWTFGSDRLFFGNGLSGGLQESQLSQIVFYSGGVGSAPLGTGTFGTNGEVVAVPEPSALALALPLLGLSWRGLRRRC